MGEDVREQLITFIGGGLVIGGTASRLPENYYEGVSEVFGRAEDEDWQVWWESTGLPPLELWCWIGGGVQGAKVRRTQFKVTARLERDHRGADADPGQAAGVRDARDLIQALVKRFSLSAPPDPLAQSVSSSD